MKDALEELRKDFKEMLGCIDFQKYDPYSKLFMRALFIGQMYMAVKILDDDSDNIGSDIEEELNGAKGYYNLFNQTGDTTFRDMASDELRHAGILIKKHLQKNVDAVQKEMLNSYESKRQEMMKMIEPKKTIDV